ncbi:DUF4129 domain-containing protein [Microbacterium pumilum]|uniref:DUF4129 domain-containing protein n=1 Tax=Microbacterium pumilum TaxID=344165 RepID=A0ABN2SFM9_9MICO
MGLTATVAGLRTRLADVGPLTPSGDEARRLAENELAKPVYQAAEPTVIDRIARAVGQFFERLFQVELGGGWGSAFAIVATILVVILIVVAFIVWGRPRAVRRAAAPPAALFGETESRSADELRRDAASRASMGEWDAAVVLRFRALARGVIERGAVDTPPGATVHAFARAAGRAFPSAAVELEAAATAFDDVRYLRRPGTAELYRRVAEIDDLVVATRPVDADSAGVPV